MRTSCAELLAASMMRSAPPSAASQSEARAAVKSAALAVCMVSASRWAKMHSAGRSRTGATKGPGCPRLASSAIIAAVASPERLRMAPAGGAAPPTPMVGLRLPRGLFMRYRPSRSGSDVMDLPEALGGAAIDPSRKKDHVNLRQSRRDGRAPLCARPAVRASEEDRESDGDSGSRRAVLSHHGRTRLCRKRGFALYDDARELSPPAIGRCETNITSNYLVGIRSDAKRPPRPRWAPPKRRAERCPASESFRR